MSFNKHSNLEGRHAFLSPSGFSWINYDDDRLIKRFAKYKAAARGTALHKLAQDAINLKIQISTEEETIGLYVRDCILDGLTPEQPLYYSENCFGTADAIAFSDGILRIYDLKTGVIEGSPNQLKVYAALFSLEYDVWPTNIVYDLRLYQNESVIMFDITPGDIIPIIDKIVDFDKKIEEMKEVLI